MQKSPFFFRHLSLRWLLIVPFVVQIVGAVGLVGYLSYRVGQKSVAASVNHLMAETKEHVIEHLDSYLVVCQAKDCEFEGKWRGYSLPQQIS
jgi:hypothetical protein